MELGDFLKRYRQEKQVSRSELARLMGVNVHRLQKWEDHNYKPKVEDSDKIKAYFLINDYEDLTETFLANRVRSETWKRPKSTKKEGAQIEEKEIAKEKIMSHMMGNIASIESALNKLKKAVEDLKK